MTDEDRTRARTILEAALAELGRPATSGQIDALAGLAALVSRWSQAVNLTGHRGTETIAKRLVADACALEAALPALDSLADIGSGAGFPGLPIAILRGCRVTSIESRERRVHFQRAALRELAIRGVEVLWGRAEQLPATPHAAAVAQAVSPETAAPLLERWTEPGGLLIFVGGEEPPAPPPGIRFSAEIPYRVPLGGPARTLALARR